MILNVLWTSTLRAENQIPEVLKKCAQTVESCKKTVDAKNEQIKLQDLGLKQLSEEQARLKQEIRQKDEALSSTLRNPLFMTMVGVVIGVLVTGIVKK